MTVDDAADVTLDALERLPSLSPDPARAERVRARCRTQLRRRRHLASGLTVIGLASRVVAPAVVGGFCVVYLAELVTLVVRLGVLR